MIRIILLSLLSLFTFQIFSQSKTNGIVYDKSNNQPIAYASVFWINSNIGTYSNEKGEFEITSSKNISDTLAISMIGYSRYYYCQRNNTSSSKIYLTPSPIVIPFVKITPKKYKEKIVGHKPDWLPSYCDAGSGAEVMTLIKNPKYENSIINTVYFQYNKLSNNKIVYRIQFYDVINDGGVIIPGVKLLQTSVEKPLLKGKNEAVIDISSYNLKFPLNGVFVGVEWIGYKDSSDLIVENNSLLGVRFSMYHDFKETITYCGGANSEKKASNLNIMPLNLHLSIRLKIKIWK